jgi:hypothetical protein
MLVAVVLTSAPQSAARSVVDVVRVPDAGIQPDVVVDAAGVLHLVSLAGPPGNADVFYTYSRDARARRKHPRLAVGKDGTVLLAWAAGTGWNKGGAVGWQLFVKGAPVGPLEVREDLPVWSFPAVAAVGDRLVLLC